MAVDLVTRQGFLSVARQKLWWVTLTAVGQQHSEARTSADNGCNGQSLVELKILTANAVVQISACHTQCPVGKAVGPGCGSGTGPVRSAVRPALLAVAGLLLPTKPELVRDDVAPGAPAAL